MFKIVLAIFVIIVLIALRKVKIKWRTFLRRGFKKKSKPYGVYCYCGKQGKGKTYSVIEFLRENKNLEIYANIKSIKGINYTYFSGFDELLKLQDKKNCIIVYDEIFTALTKSSKLTTQVLSFLSQMRKREIIFITTAQEWLEINITLRRYCRFQIECNMISILGYPILIKHLYDAEQMKWSNLDNEYIAPLIETTISHGMKKVVNSYDTFEEISNENKSPITLNSDSNTFDSEFKVSPNGENNHTIAITTTNSNGVVNGQNINFDSFDDDFWGSLTDDDFEVDYDEEI